MTIYADVLKQTGEQLDRAAREAHQLGDDLEQALTHVDNLLGICHQINPRSEAA